MQKIRAAVIGVGYLGRFHAQKYAQAADCELVAVVDPRAAAREQVAGELATRGLEDYRELLGKVDAVSIVTPTPAHFAIARDFLRVRRARAGRETDHRDRGRGARADRAGRRRAAPAAGRSPRALQFRDPGRRAAPALAALHRVSPPGAVPRARHRRERGARSDDPRHRHRADHRRRADREHRCGRHAGVFRGDRHRQRAPAFRQRLRGECDRLAGQPEDRAQDAHLRGRRLPVPRPAAEDPDADPETSRRPRRPGRCR